VKLEARNGFLFAALLVAACVLTYANGLTGGFTYDDKAVVRDNPRIRAPERIGQIFGTPYFGGPPGTGSAYRPVLLLSFAVQWWIHGGDPVLFHAGNVLLHGVATLLLWRLLRRLAMPPPAAFGAALLFAVHPLHVEAVTSVVGRGEAQAAVCVLLYLFAALRVAERRGTLAALAAALVCYVLGTLTKESAAMAPALAFLAIATRAEGGLAARARAAFARGWPLYLGSAAALIGIFALRARVLGGALKNAGTGIYELENPLAPLAALPRVWNAVALLVRYVGRTIFPLELTADESAWSLPIWDGRSPLARASVLLLAAATIAALARLRSSKLAAFGFLFFCVAFLPANNVLFPIGTVFAERLAYLPSAGLCVVLAAAIAGNASDFASLPRGRLAALAAVALLFAGRAAVRNTIWRTDEALFASSVRTSPGSAKTWYNDGFIAVERKDARRGRESARRATEIYTGYWDAFAVKGRAERDLGLLAEAEASYARSVAINAAYENGWFGLGGAREARGNLAGAEEAYAAGLAQKVDSLPLAFALARVRSALDRPTADGDWRRAVGIGASSVAVRLGFAGWLAARGREADARWQWREALRREPLNLETLRLLAGANARDGLPLAECLALEKIWRLTRAADDRAALDRAASSCPAYQPRWKLSAAAFASRTAAERVQNESW
jgi:tetratricopeptide (TPR) repeat protein